MKFDDLTLELQEKVKACATPEELMALAKAEGYELSDAELEQVSGGGYWDPLPEDAYPSDPYCDWFTEV